MHPDLVADHPRVLTTDWTYVRYHGPDALRTPYLGAYGEDRLAREAAGLAEWLEDGVDVYAYFNNDWYGHAFFEAQSLRRHLDTWTPRTVDA